MTHEETSYQTKMMLCASLKKIMKHKPFSKITVSELIKDCDLNRKTFYYHFEDIYRLLKWTLEQETFLYLRLSRARSIKAFPLSGFHRNHGKNCPGYRK